MVLGSGIAEPYEEVGTSACAWLGYETTFRPGLLVRGSSSLRAMPNRRRTKWVELMPRMVIGLLSSAHLYGASLVHGPAADPSRRSNSEHVSLCVSAEGFTR